MALTYSSTIIIVKLLSDKKESGADERQRHSRWLDALMDRTVAKIDQEAGGYLTPQTQLVKGWARDVIPSLGNWTLT